MTREEAIQIVRELWAAASARDTARVMSLYSDYAVLVSPVWGRITDRNAIMKTWEDTFTRFPDASVTIEDILVDGERVTVLGKFGATDHNGWFGQAPAPTGEWFEYRTAMSYTFRDGKIVRDERIYDLTSLLQRFEKTRLDKELQMAADVQRALLSHSTHVSPYCEAAGDSIPCRAIGGDFFELVELPSGDFGSALGDVAGKGPASALLASMIQGMLAIELNSESSPAAVLGRLNEVLFHRGLDPRFATLVYSVLSGDGRFVYANAGHNPPVLLSGDLIQRLTTGGPVLGTFAESAYQQEMVRLKHGDSLVLFSDGVCDATDTRGEEFGEDRLIASAKLSVSSSATEILQRILGAVREFCKGAPQADDITVAVVKYRG